MEEEEFLKDVKEAEAEIKEHRVGKLKPEKQPLNPFTYIIGLILLLLIIMMVIPYYGIKLDPEPKNIPTLSDIKPNNIAELSEEYPGHTKASKASYTELLIPSHQAIKNTAARIATQSCKESAVCYSKALFYFVRDNFQYISDPPDDYLESPFETMYIRGADCDGMSILLANLQLGVGIPTRLAFIPGHVYVQVKIDDAPNKYKEADGWISLDPTCNSCEFGQVPYSTMNKKKEFLYLS